MLPELQSLSRRLIFDHLSSPSVAFLNGFPMACSLKKAGEYTIGLTQLSELFVTLADNFRYFLGAIYNCGRLSETYSSINYQVKVFSVFLVNK